MRTIKIALSALLLCASATQAAEPAKAKVGEWQAVEQACQPSYAKWWQANGRKFQSEPALFGPLAHGELIWSNGTRAEVMTGFALDGRYCVLASRFLERTLGLS